MEPGTVNLQVCKHSISGVVDFKINSMKLSAHVQAQIDLQQFLKHINIHIKR